MDMSPLAVSLFQIHFEIPNNIQTITVFLALEVAPVLYIYSRTKNKKHWPNNNNYKKKEEEAINCMAMLSRYMQHIRQNS